MSKFGKYTREEIEALLAAGCVMDPADFAFLGGFTLRRYQQGVMEAVCHSALEKQGRSFVVMFPRQSGKNELQAQIEAFLLYRLRIEGAEMVKVSPTWKPQSLNAMRRLERVLRANLATEHKWRKESGYIFSIGKARIYFLSGAPETNIVGATASALLEVDEAQDVETGKFDRDIAPMAASTNATRVYWGTAWTSQTLLARELEAARRLDLLSAAPGSQTAFVLTSDDVSAEVAEYGRYVAGQVQKLGRNHPLVRTQYFSETIDGQGGMFPAERVSRMFAEGAAAWENKDAVYALLLDVAGEKPPGSDLSALDEISTGATGTDAASKEDYSASAAADQSAGRRDATALTVVAVDMGGLRDPALRAPIYHPVERRQWVGVSHTRLYSEIRAAAAAYRARYVVVDATGIGAGLASFLERALPGKVVRFLFTTASKSRLGWDFLSLVDGGRWREDGVVGEGKMGDGAVGNEAMRDGSMSEEKMDNGAMGDGSMREDNLIHTLFPLSSYTHSSSTHTISTHTISTHLPSSPKTFTDQPSLQRLFLQQLASCQYQVLPGPLQTLRWGVPDTARDPLSGAYLHDDLLISAALSTVLDRQDWRSSPGGQRKEAGIVQGKDPLEAMKGF